MRVGLEFYDNDRGFYPRQWYGLFTIVSLRFREFWILHLTLNFEFHIRYVHREVYD